jgi:hypothetical protein
MMTIYDLSCFDHYYFFISILLLGSSMLCAGNLFVVNTTDNKRKTRFSVPNNIITFIISSLYALKYSGTEYYFYSSSSRIFVCVIKIIISQRLTVNRKRLHRKAVFGFSFFDGLAFIHSHLFQFHGGQPFFERIHQYFVGPTSYF